MFKGAKVPKGKLEIFTIHSLKITKISGIVCFVMLFQMTLLISWQTKPAASNKNMAVIFTKVLIAYILYALV